MHRVSRCRIGKNFFFKARVVRIDTYAASVILLLVAYGRRLDSGQNFRQQAAFRYNLLWTPQLVVDDAVVIDAQ